MVDFVVPLLPLYAPPIDNMPKFIMAGTTINDMSVFVYVKRLLEENIIKEDNSKEIGRNYLIFSEFKPEIYYGELISSDELKTLNGPFNLHNLYDTSYSYYKFCNMIETGSRIPPYQLIFKKYYKTMHGGKSLRKHIYRQKGINHKRKYSMKCKRKTSVKV